MTFFCASGKVVCTVQSIKYVFEHFSVATTPLMMDTSWHSERWLHFMGVLYKGGGRVIRAREFHSTKSYSRRLRRNESQCYASIEPSFG